ncbi:hypothetical protein GCM10020219_070100 [Nonomuraea dietziae]
MIVAYDVENAAPRRLSQNELTYLRRFADRQPWSGKHAEAAGGTRPGSRGAGENLLHFERGSPRGCPGLHGEFALEGRGRVCRCPLGCGRSPMEFRVESVQPGPSACTASEPVRAQGPKTRPRATGRPQAA